MKVQQKLAIVFIRTKINILSLFSKRKAAEETFRIFCTPLMKGPLKERDAFRHAERLQFRHNGLLIKGFRINAPRAKKILLLHGFSSGAYNFDKYVDALTAKGYEVLAFDAPAHGSSEGKTVNAVEYSEMIKDVHDRYGPVEAFIGHSFGGLAISLAMENIPHDASTKIVLIAPATETTSAIDDAFRMIGLKNKQLRDEFERIIFERSGKEPGWFSVRRAMNHISASVLWVHDEDDDITPLTDALKVKEDAHPNVDFFITKGLGHRKIYRDERVVERIAKFL